MTLTKEEMLAEPGKCADKMIEGEEDPSEGLAILLGLDEVEE